MIMIEIQYSDTALLLLVNQHILYQKKWHRVSQL